MPLHGPIVPRSADAALEQRRTPEVRSHSIPAPLVDVATEARSMAVPEPAASVSDREPVGAPATSPPSPRVAMVPMLPMEQLVVRRRPEGDLVALLRAAQRPVGAADGAAHRFVHAARNELMLELYPRVRSFLHLKLGRMGRQDDVVLDLTQETMLLLTRHLGTCQAAHDGAVVEWALVVAERTLLEAIRSPSSPLAERILASELRAHLRSVLTLDPVDGDVPEQHPAWQLLLEVTMQAYDDAAEEVRGLFWWRLVAGWTWPEIARMLGSTPTAIKRRFQRAQESLRRDALRRIEQLSPSDREAVRALLGRVAPATGASGHSAA